MLSGVLLAVLVGILMLIVSSRSLEYRQQEEDIPQESPSVPADGPTWTIVLEPSASPETSEQPVSEP